MRCDRIRYPTGPSLCPAAFGRGSMLTGDEQVDQAVASHDLACSSGLASIAQSELAREIVIRDSVATGAFNLVVGDGSSYTTRDAENQ